MSNKKFKKIIIVLIVGLVAISFLVFGFVYFKLNSIYESKSNTMEETNYKSEKDITNILLCGSDGRPGETSSRTDSMMILTIDSKSKNLKLTSLARDTYVSTIKYGKIKLGEAHAYGGIDLLVETIERNFKLDIQNYILVDFYSFMDIVDTLGGINVDIRKNEIKELNKYIPETYKLNSSNNKGEIVYIKNPGEQNLNGYQALAYCRIRKGTSGGATERDRRQREAIESMTRGIKDLSFMKYPKLVDVLLPYVKTNINPSKVIDLGRQVLKIGTTSIDQMEFPINDGVNGRNVRIKDKEVVEFEPSSVYILHDFIFENVVYENKK